MAFRTWAKLLAATLGVGALAGASQLGLVYGLGIVRLTRVLDVTTRDQWTAQLAWVAWMPTLAAVLAALVGAALLRRWSPSSPPPGVGTELALAFAAAIGAGVVVPLTMQPARTAQVAGVNPVVVIAICAGLGALVGVFAAWAALAQAIARWSLLTTGAAVWLIALVSVAPSLAPSDPLPAVRLGVFDAGFLSPAVTQRTALATMPALALLIGAALGWAARRRELPTLTIALAGLPGPALLTIAYLIAGPGAGDDRYQVVPYWAAMTATGAGVLGSVLAAVLRRGPGADDEDDPEDQAAEKPPLPRRTNQPESAIAAAGGQPAGDAPTAVDQPVRPVDTGVFDLPPRGRPGDSPTTEFPAGPSDPTDRPYPGPAHSTDADHGSGFGRGAVSARGSGGGADADHGSGFGRGAVSARGSGGGAEADHATGLGEPAASPTGSGAGPAGLGAGMAGPGPAGLGAGMAGPGAGLGGPAPTAAKPEKPRRRSRRSSVADAFIGRTGEFPASRPGGSPASRPGSDPTSWPGGDSADYPTPRSGSDPATRSSGGPAASRPGDGAPAYPSARSGAADPRGGDPAPFDAFARGEAPRSGGTPWSPAGDAPHAAPESGPYVPEPATRPLPPGVGTSTAEQPRTGGRLGRGLRQFGRSKNAEPLTPEPTPISAPLPQPDPVTPPLAVTPAPRPETAPRPEAAPRLEPPAGDSKRKSKGGKDEDYVDWVSGLGK